MQILYYEFKKCRQAPVPLAYAFSNFVKVYVLYRTDIFSGSVSPYKLGKVVLKLQAGLFSNVVMPETVESLWGPVSLGRLPPGVVNHCTVANHKYVIMSSL